MSNITWDDPADKKHWEAQVDRYDPQVFDRALDAMWKVDLNFRSIDLMDGHRANIKAMVAYYLKEHSAFNFKGMAHDMEKATDLIIDGPHSAWWKDSGSADWILTATGLGTFDNIFPESAAFINVDPEPDHYAYLAGLIEVGTSNNLRRLYFTNINGQVKGRMSVGMKSLLGDLRVIRFSRGVELLDDGQIRIDGEYETAIDSELLPLAVHVLPHKVAMDDNLSDYVTAT